MNNLFKYAVVSDVRDKAAGISLTVFDDNDLDFSSTVDLTSEEARGLVALISEHLDEVVEPPPTPPPGRDVRGRTPLELLERGSVPLLCRLGFHKLVHDKRTIGIAIVGATCVRAGCDLRVPGIPVPPEPKGRV